MTKKNEKDTSKGKIIIYKSDGGPSIDVRLVKDTVWLTLNQMASLFERNKSVISRHIKNIFQTGELNKKSTVAFFATVQNEGGRLIKRQLEYYNLDVIISVGYRVNSKRGTQFRIWATKILKEYLVKGFTINKKLLIGAQEKLNELHQTISFLQEKSKHKLLLGQEQEILTLLANYSKTFSLLEQYDKERLSLVKKMKGIFILEYDEARKIVDKLKKELVEKKEASDLFGLENSSQFKSTLGNIYQTFNGKELYPSLEEKASYLLYFIIKNHPFVDGNKRIASFLFVYFLDKNDYLYKNSGEKKINDNALTTLALLIAVSEPKEKDKIIKIITNLLLS